MSTAILLTFSEIILRIMNHFFFKVGCYNVTQCHLYSNKINIVAAFRGMHVSPAKHSYT